MPSTFHKRVAKKIQNMIECSLKGANYRDYQDSGHRADAFYIGYQGMTITIEVIKTATKKNIVHDYDIIQNSLSKIKLVVVHPNVYKLEDNMRAFEKIRISEMRKGYIIHELLNGQKLLTDIKYEAYVMELIRYSITLLTTDSKKTEIHVADIKDNVIKPFLSFVRSHRTSFDPNGLASIEPNLSTRFFTSCFSFSITLRCFCPCSLLYQVIKSAIMSGMSSLEIDFT
jgi:hypothetical protein